MSSRKAVVYLALLAAPVAVLAGERTELEEEISVTATRAPRRTRDVPQAIAVVGKDVIDDNVVYNVKDVVAGTPGVLVETKSGGYDARLLIRGAGLKATYGVREIMVLRDGVPLTDPDSFSRLDWIDTQDIERLEISKGPGNLFSPGSAGGAIQIISRSVFDRGSDTAQVGYGTFGAADLHLRKSVALGEANALALTASYRRQENAWREWNHFQSFQGGLKHGARLGAGTLETEVSFTKADLQLPGALDPAGYAEFVRTGTQEGTSEPWKNSGRYSKSLFVNSKLEQPLGDLTLKPRVYYNQWTHRHPVTGSINDPGAWTHNLGTDLETQHRHAVGPGQGTLVLGVTAKGEWNDDVRRYQYRDVTKAPSGRILATRSDAEGALLETQSQKNLLGGVFAQESIQLGRVLLDVGGRFDRSWMRVRTNELGAFNWSTGAYGSGAGVSVVNKTFDLPAPKVGLSVRVTDAVSVYGSAAQAGQVPSESEVLSNPSLRPARSTSYEVGTKVRAGWATADLAAFYNVVADEIVQVLTSGSATEYQNAGRTKKLGVEVSGSVRLPARFELGASYAYSDFTYASFTEIVRGVEKDRSGNRLPLVPVHQYGAFLAWRHPVGVRLRVSTNTWGRYWMDNANTARYPGYGLLTSVAAAWSLGRHELLVDATNVFDERYAASATRDATGTKDLFAAGTPRTVLASYLFRL